MRCLKCLRQLRKSKLEYQCFIEWRSSHSLSGIQFSIPLRNSHATIVGSKHLLHKLSSCRETSVCKVINFRLLSSCVQKLKYEATADALLGNTVFTNEHFLAVNKPVGQSVYGSTLQDETPCVMSLLPYLCNKMHIPSLEIGLSLKSFYSGIVLLCKTSDAKIKLEKCLRDAAAHKQQFLSYLAITVATPQCSLETDLTAYISRDFFHNRELSTVWEEDNKSARKTGKMMVTSVSMRQLTNNEDLGVALIEVSINRDKWEAVEALLSHFLSPVLGDHLYSSRTQYVMGVPFRASAHSVLPKPQRLPQKLREILETFEPRWFDGSSSLPLFMHRHKASFIKHLNAENVPLEITAPPPPLFTSVAKLLGLHTPYILDLNCT